MITIYISSIITTDEADEGTYFIIVHTSLDVSESIITDPSR